MRAIFFILAGGVIAFLAKLLVLIQSLFSSQRRERALTVEEKNMLAKVYRNSVALDPIRLVEGHSGFFHINDRPFALGNLIYMKAYTDPGTLVHEVCHVWQYQHIGTRYIAEALWAQWFVPDAYNWEAELARGHAHWQELNKEAQAQLIQDVYNTGRQLPPKNARGDFYEDDPIGSNVEFKRNGIDYAQFARESIQQLRHS